MTFHVDPRWIPDLELDRLGPGWGSSGLDTDLDPNGPGKSVQSSDWIPHFVFYVYTLEPAFVLDMTNPNQCLRGKRP